MSDFGDYLKNLREAKGFTLNQTAAYSGISAAQLSRIENGKRGVPKPLTIKALSIALKADYNELMKVAGYIDAQEPKPHKNSNDNNLSIELSNEKDVAKRLEKVKKDLENAEDGDGYMLMGEPISEEAKQSIIEAMEFAIRQSNRINKKYTPKKYRKE